MMWQGLKPVLAHHDISIVIAIATRNHCNYYFR